MDVIIVKATPRDITVEPTRIGFSQAAATRTVQWLAVGSGIRIDAVEFKDPNAPIQNLHAVPNGWEGTWSTANQGIWGYIVTVSVNGVPKPPLDPEIENGPPGGGMGEDDEDDEDMEDDDDEDDEDDEDEVEEDGERW
ncbi:MAG TPA: hypothetical protein VJG13_10480 [Thermoanaerobaculia bacterium]|nr:hypothetical protein [Thermoanaerobaculia bacterium]